VVGDEPVSIETSRSKYLAIVGLLSPFSAGEETAVGTVRRLLEELVLLRKKCSAYESGSVDSWLRSDREEAEINRKWIKDRIYGKAETSRGEVSVPSKKE